MSESSETSSKGDDNVLDTHNEINEETEMTNNSSDRKYTTLCGDLEQKGINSVKDILTEPIETTTNSANIESNYNRIDFKQPLDVSPPPATIISTITVAKPGYQTSLLLDEKGYSHVNLASVKCRENNNKTRSMSTSSNQSAVSCRSVSLGSRDSGILTQSNKDDIIESREPTHRSTNSFDSAVSTSSTVEHTESPALDAKPNMLSVEIHEVEVTIPDCIMPNQPVGEGCIYQDVSFEESQSDSMSKIRPKLRKSNSTGHFHTDENPYEELDKYRKGKKDLVKHLGMDPKVDPSSVPPSLPDRPLSYKMKRKFAANNDKRLFTLPFSKHKSKKNREKALSSTSSESDSESSNGTKKRDDLSSMKVWPLGNMSIADSNDLYQPVAIERFLNDTEATTFDIKRERSCSLNLNRISDIKRPSVSSVNFDIRGSSRVRHGRNISLNLDLTQDSDLNVNEIHSKLFKQKQTSLTDSIKTDSSSTVSRVQFSVSPSSSLDNGMTVDEDNSSAKSDNDEPIYAEVLPVRSKTQDIEEPFPDLDEWKPQNMSDFQTNELDDTGNENDGDTVTDLFNIGFVTDIEPSGKSENNVPKTGILIDICDTDTSIDVNKSQTQSALDIFNTTNSTLSNQNSGQNTVIPEQMKADMNQVFLDIFSLGNATTQPVSTTDPWKGSSKHESFVTNASVNVGDNWADFSQFEASQRETTNTVSDSIYMDMSNYNNESIYVLPSEATQQR